jgi:hypothetical protein
MVFSKLSLLGTQLIQSLIALFGIETPASLEGD